MVDQRTKKASAKGQSPLQKLVFFFLIGASIYKNGIEGFSPYDGLKKLGVMEHIEGMVHLIYKLYLKAVF